MNGRKSPPKLIYSSHANTNDDKTHHPSLSGGSEESVSLERIVSCNFGCWTGRHMTYRVSQTGMDDASVCQLLVDSSHPDLLVT